MHKLCLLSGLLLLAAVACQPAPSGPRSVASWEADTPEERQPLPTFTPYPTATPFPTVELEEAIDLALVTPPSLIPTAVPAGIFYHESSGFTLPYPQDWEVVQDFGSEFVLQDSALGVRLTINVSFETEEDSLDAFATELQEDEALREALSVESFEVAEQNQLPFATGTAENLRLIAETEFGPLEFWLTMAKAKGRTYTFIAFSDPESIDNRLQTLTTMLAQSSFNEEQLFGLNRAETLVLLGGDPPWSAFDPALTTGSAAGYVGLLFRGLVRLTPTLQVVPDLAERWDVSEDGTVYTFTLREGIAFSDGDPITANDVKLSWERAADPDTGSTTAATYLGDILGVTEKIEGDALTISGLEVIDERTLQVTLDGPKPYFLAKLTYPTSFVIDRFEVNDFNRWVLNTNYSGPYQVGEYRRNQGISFVRNPEYHTLPAVENVVYLFTTGGSAISLYQAGEIDVVNIGGSDVEDARRPSSETNAQWQSNTTLCTTMLQMNNTLPPFDDPDVRKAFALALDKETLNEILNEGQDLVAQTVLPPAMPGYSLTLSEEMAAAHAFDPEAARSLLENSSYGADLPVIRLLAGGTGDIERDDLNAYITSWEENLGVDVEIEYIGIGEFNAGVRENPGHMTQYGWCADYPDPENFLDLLYFSESDFNVGGFVDPQVNANLILARTELDPATRLQLYQETEAQLLQEVATIPLFHTVRNVLVKPYVEGYVLSPMGTQIIDEIVLQPRGEDGAETASE